MNKRTAAVILELIPIVSAPLFYILMTRPTGSGAANHVITITMLLAFFGFIFFFIGRRLAKGDRAVRILGVLDWLATASVIAVYVLAAIVFGL